MVVMLLLQVLRLSLIAFLKQNRLKYNFVSLWPYYKGKTFDILILFRILVFTRILFICLFPEMVVQIILQEYILGFQAHQK